MKNDFMKENWEIKKLGDCFDIVKNGANIKQDSNADGYPITRIETTSNDVFNRDKLGYANVYNIDKYKDYVLKNNDILISHINSTKYLGRAVLYEKQEGETIIHGMNLLNLSGINSNILPKYLAYYFKSADYKIQIFKITKKAVNQASFTTTALKSIEIPIPPLPVQETIVKELDILHHLKELQEQQLAEYDNLAQSTFYSMFGDPIDNEKGWEVRKLGEVVKPKSKIKRAKKEIDENDVISYIDISSIDNSTNKITSFTEYVFSEAPSRAQQVVEVGDIVVSLVRPNLNNVAILEEEYSNSVASSGFCVLRPSTINLQFLFYIVKGDKFRAYLSARTAGANYPAVREEDIKSFDLFYPPLSLQTDFANRIEKIEAQKELVKQGIAETQLLIDYTMDKYFG
jgi:type I restriction enzyme S subunit